MSPADGVSSAALAASSLAGVPMLTPLSPAECMSKKIVMLTAAIAPMEAKLRRGLRQRRAGLPCRPDDENPGPSIGFPGNSGFTISAGVSRISDAIALKPLCCEGEVEPFPGSLGVIIRA